MGLLNSLMGLGSGPDYSDAGMAKRQAAYDKRYAEGEKNGTLQEYSFPGDKTPRKMPKEDVEKLKKMDADGADFAAKNPEVAAKFYADHPELKSNDVQPTKIDVATGAGVPGGFEAASVKSPTAEVERMNSSISSIDSKTNDLSAAKSALSVPSLPSANSNLAVGSLGLLGSAAGLAASVKSGGLSAIPAIPGLSMLGILGATKILDGLKAKAMNKLKTAAKAPDFTKKYKLPSPPSLPSTPDFKSLGIPEVPSVPSMPSVPSLPSTSGLSLPSMPSVPSSPSMPSVPSLPSIPKLPSIG